MAEIQQAESFLTIRQAAEKLQVSVYTMRRYVRSGLVPAVKMGRDWRVPVRVLRDLADSASGRVPTAAGESVEK